MRRIVVVLIAALALSAQPSPAYAQEALKGLGFAHPAPADRSPALFLGPVARGSATLARTVDRRALRVFAVTAPQRLSWSTAPIAGIPAAVSWNSTHTALAGAFVVTLLVDAAQTRELARHGWSNFREANPLLGDRPSVGRVNSYTLMAGLGVLGAAAALPPRLRPWLLGAAIAVQALTVGGSVRNGLPIRFP
jgi:hypothetical protein